MDELRTVADELQAQDEYIHMAAIAEGKVRLVPTLVALEFVNASMEETRASVQTRETWDFVQESLSTRQPLVRQRGLIYELAWDLSRREDGSWYVEDVRAIETTATAPTEQLVPGAVGGLHP